MTTRGHEYFDERSRQSGSNCRRRLPTHFVPELSRYTASINMLTSRCGCAISVLLSAVLLCGAVKAQDTELSHTTVFAEVGGNGMFYSVNADYRIRQSIGVRAGVTAIEVPGTGLYGGPLMLTALPGWKAHRAEIGAGVLLGYLANRSVEAYVGDTPDPGQAHGTAIPTFSVGYRYHQPEGGLFFRVVYTPMIIESEWENWGGLGVGYTLSE